MPQHAKRIKIQRKALRQPDEFHSLTTRAAVWVEAHRTVAVAVSALVVAVLVVVLGVGWYRSARAATAAARFREAHALFDAGKNAEAAAAFAELGDHYGTTPYGRLAGLYRAHALARQEDAAGAAAAYEEYLASSPPTEYLRQAALDGLGHAKEASGDAAAALQAYTEAGALAGPYRTDVRLGAARLHEAAGRRDQAQAIYAELAKENLDPGVKALVQSKLSPLPGAAPAEGTPPPQLPGAAPAEGTPPPQP